MPAESPSFGGLHVAAFESRRRSEMASLIERFGGVAHVSPSMREVARELNPEAVDFAHRVMTGQVDLVIFLTGVGTRLLIAQVERHVDRDRFLAALSDMHTIARGPKSVAALKEFGIAPTWRVPEPNTWRELLQTIDEQTSVANQVVGIQEYGLPNPSLVAGLEARGATVINVKVYSWELPEDTAPLAENIKAIAAGQRDVAMFTSGHQVVNLLKLAGQMGLTDALRQQFERMVVASIGPTTSEALRECEVPVDLEPEHPKMGHLVMAAAADAASMLRKKRSPSIPTHVTASVQPPIGGLQRPERRPGGSNPSAPWHDSPFLKACRREPTSVTPIWLMRQAGRYLPEYREIRSKTTFLELCKNPDLAAEVMIRSVARLGVDAAIIFSDLLPILEPMGMDLEFTQGEGPVIHNPVREPTDVDRVHELQDAQSLDYVMETVRRTRAGLPPTIPLIGFAGAPFTLASYAIEGGGSRSFLHTKTLMYRDPGAWEALMGRLVRSLAHYVNAQLAAGAQAVQLFDSWVGCLSPEDYRRYVLPHTRALIEAITPGAPVIHFGTGNPALVPLMAEAGGTVIGVDWRIELDAAWQAVGHERAIQGNLDPAVLLAGRDEIRRQAKRILDQAGGRPGHIFNLGHGVLPQTPPESAIALVDAVHELTAR